MANRVDPPERPVRKNDTELDVVIGFFQDLRGQPCPSTLGDPRGGRVRAVFPQIQLRERQHPRPAILVYACEATFSIVVRVSRVRRL